MHSNAPLRDPFANDDEKSASGSSVPSRDLTRPRSIGGQLRNDGGGSSRLVPEASKYTGSLGVPRTAASSASGNAASSSAPRSLGLSLGVPRSRMAKRDHDVGTSADSASTPGTARQADEAVRNTDSDALLSRLSALKLGYLPAEPFTQEFSSASSSANPNDTLARRSPLINIGTYLRCSTIDKEVEAFLRQGDGLKQIISIGAGSDSRYWRIMSDPRLSNQLHHYVEVDFPENTNQKLSRILRSSKLRSLLDSDTAINGVPLDSLATNTTTADEQSRSPAKRFDVIRSSRYALLAADLRSLHPDTAAAERIDPDMLFGPASTNLQPDLPTLILFECVLSYIPSERSDSLIRLLGQRYDTIQAISYDIALAGDAESRAIQSDMVTASQAALPPSRFGKVMLQNLEVSLVPWPDGCMTLTLTARLFLHP